jgi:hypothetical protein
MSVVDSITSVEYREIPGVIGYRFGSDGTAWTRWTQGHHILKDEWRLLKQGRGRKGYRTIGIDRRTCQVHALICRAFYGLPPLRLLEARHLNDDRSDNRIENLAWGTRKQNREDMVRNGRSARGERVNLAKLTEAQVREIRHLWSAGVMQIELAARFGVDRMSIHRITSRQTWKHVD